MTEKRFDIIGVGVHTIDTETVGKLATFDKTMNLSVTGPNTSHPGGWGNSMPVAAALLPGRVGGFTVLGKDALGRQFMREMADREWI